MFIQENHVNFRKQDLYLLECGDFSIEGEGGYRGRGIQVRRPPKRNGFDQESVAKGGWKQNLTLKYVKYISLKFCKKYYFCITIY